MVSVRDAYASLTYAEHKTRAMCQVESSFGKILSVEEYISATSNY